MPLAKFITASLASRKSRPRTALHVMFGMTWNWQGNSLLLNDKATLICPTTVDIFSPLTVSTSEYVLGTMMDGLFSQTNFLTNSASITEMQAPVSTRMSTGTPCMFPLTKALRGCLLLGVNGPFGECIVSVILEAG